MKLGLDEWRSTIVILAAMVACVHCTAFVAWWRVVNYICSCSISAPPTGSCTTVVNLQVVGIPPFDEGSERRR